MNKILYVFCIAAAISLAGCTKEDNTKLAPDAESQAQIQDNNQVKAESDQANTDIDAAAGGEGQSEIGGRVAAEPICGVDTIIKDPTSRKAIRIIFDGVNPCLENPRRLRSGEIEIELIRGDHWWEAGAKMKVTFKNYKVTRLPDSASIMLNGVKYRTNVKGSLGFVLGTDSLVVQERANNVQVTYRNGDQGNFSMARVFKAKRRINTLVQFDAVVAGDTNLFGPGTDVWGTGRFNNAYSTAFTLPWISNTVCGLGYPTSGQYVAKSSGNTVTITLGVGTDGLPHTASCAYGYKLDWTTSGGATGSAVRPYGN